MTGQFCGSKMGYKLMRMLIITPIEKGKIGWIYSVGTKALLPIFA